MSADAAGPGIREYPLEGGAVVWEAARCRHAAACVRGLPAVFDTQKRPWIQPGNAAPSEVERVVGLCPSRALTFRAEPEPGDPNAPGADAAPSSASPAGPGPT